jgi:hypothetical protein
MPYLAKFFRLLPDPTAINLNYLHGLNHDQAWEVGWYGPKKGVVFKSNHYTAVIMPMRMDI